MSGADNPRKITLHDGRVIEINPYAVTFEDVDRFLKRDRNSPEGEAVAWAFFEKLTGVTEEEARAMPFKDYIALNERMGELLFGKGLEDADPS